jgi:hypothetical protein
MYISSDPKDLGNIKVRKMSGNGNHGKEMLGSHTDRYLWVPCAKKTHSIPAMRVRCCEKAKCSEVQR